MNSPRAPAALVQPRHPSNTPGRLDGRLDGIAGRPTVQPTASVQAPAGAPVGAGARTAAQAGAHTRDSVGQVGRLDEGQGQPGYRDMMPRVWDEIRRLKARYGAEWVAECISRGQAGEPDWFFAFENGHVVGTPFKADAQLVQWLQLAVAIGGRHACVMRPKPEDAHAGT